VERELEGRVDEEQVGRFRQRIAAERESESSIDEAISDEVDEDEVDSGMDEELEEDDDFAFDVEGGEIRRK
jgi:hypothetical protein